MKIQMARTVATAMLLCAGNLLIANETTKLDDIQVVTTASGFEQNVADAPASISVITAEELQKKSYTDVIDAVKNVPGVSVSGGGNNQDIAIRGMGSAYTKYLVDGRPISSGKSVKVSTITYEGKIGAYLPPIDMIERIEIVRGPMSSLYGSDAMGGVINIITKKASNDIWRGSISPEYTKSVNDISNDEYNVNMYLSGPIIKDNLSLSLDGSFQGNDESDFTAASPNSINGSKNEKKVRKIGSELTWNINEQNDLNFRYDYTKQEYSSTIGKSLQNANTGQSYINLQKDVYMIGHKGIFNNFVTNTYFQTETTKKVEDKILEENLDTFNTQSSYNIGNHIVTFGGQYKKEKFINEANGLIGVTNFAVKEADRWEYALFVEDEWGITDNFALTTGVRYNHDELFSGEFTPRIYGVYHITDSLTLKAGVSTGYKQPNIAETLEGFGQGTGGPWLGQVPHFRILMIGNPDLEPEKSVSYEAGLNYSNNEIGLLSSLMLFQTDYKDKIQSLSICKTDSTGNANRNNYAAWNCSLGSDKYYSLMSFQNVSDAELKGVEFTLDYDLLNNLTASTSYTYTKSEQKSGDFKGEPLNNLPKNMVNVGLDYDISKNWNAWADYNYRGKTSGSNGSNDVTPGYGLFDVGVVFKATKDLSLKAGMYNIANKEITNDEYGVVLDGRRYSVGMNLRF
ncbi:TonB-dependent receptor domain-containing protein [Aliarcobacter vitoriensis]|uniref:TonB-dependent receptor n=1 Tax=Aliarcobacter vitoriensis TaxID=2011099 RepID=A0A366MVL4_9BACT|nr:TonB-dependent receptor [Aliarcobacter vitoriensis]RBQ29422.1 TonB-dependent receptor [Aliarcobacter vitoriensis]